MASENPVELPWTEQPLAELASANITYGVVQPGIPSSHGVPMVRVNNFSGHSLNLNEVMRISPEIESRYERTRLQAGDVLITVVGSVGQVAIVPAELTGWNIARAVALIRPRAPNLARWIALFLRSPIAQHRMGVAANTTVQTTVNLKDLRTLSIPMPPEPIREGISGLLGSIDDRIDLLRQTNITLEGIAQALFKSWFVDFDPVRAEPEGRDPEGMDAAATLVASEFLDSELGPIPKGWHVGTLAELSDLNASKWTVRKHPAKVKYIDLSGVNRNRIDTPIEHPFDEAPSRARHHLRDGDTIIGTVRPGNRAFAYIHAPEPNLTGSTGFAVLSSKHADLSSFVYLAATGDDSIDRLANLADGGAYPAVRPAVVAHTPCVIPSEEIARAFSELTKPMLERIAENSGKAEKLAEIRDTLLPRLISGKLRLPAVKAMIEEAIV